MRKMFWVRSKKTKPYQVGGDTNFPFWAVEKEIVLRKRQAGIIEYQDAITPAYCATIEVLIEPS